MRKSVLAVFVVFLFFINAVSAVNINSCQILSAQGIYILTADIIDDSGTCIEITSPNVLLDCQNHLIDGNNAADSFVIGADVGIYGTASNVTIKNCYVREFYRNFHLSGNNYSLTGLISRDAGNGGSGGEGISLNIGNSSAVNLTIDGTIGSFGAGSGLVLSSSTSNVFSIITSTNNDGRGIQLGSSSYLNSFNNIISNSNLIGIEGNGARFNGIRNAVVNSNGNSGISFGAGSENSNFTNIIANSNNGYGVDIQTSSIKLNNISASSNVFGGIRMIGDGLSLIAPNISGHSGSGDYGILIQGRFNNVSNGVIYNNYYGVYLYGILSSNSTGNIFTKLNITSNSQYGVYIQDAFSVNNLIYDNFLKNTNNFFISSGALNYWNITFSNKINVVGKSFTGGNFWANPSGSGFSETCADFDSNGVCDSSYNLDGTNFDYLSLSIVGGGDSDGDKIENKVDTKPVIASTCFTDGPMCYDGFFSTTSGGTTYGEVKNASSIIINDLGNLSQGINATALIAGVSLEMCATQTPISFTNAGDGGIFTCSSVIVKANPDNSGEIIILFDSESTLPSLKVIVSAGNDITLKNYTDKVSISGNGTIQILSNNSVIATVQQNPETEIDYSKSGSIITLNVTSGNATLTEGSSVSEISEGVVDEIQTAPQQPAQSGGDSGSSGGGGGGGCSVISWNCGEWGICSEETQSRTCTSNCGGTKVENRNCVVKKSGGSQDILSFLRKGWEEEALSLMLNSLEEGLPDKVREAVFGKSCESCDSQRFIVLIWTVLSLLIIFLAWGARILHTRSLSEVEEVFD